MISDIKQIRDKFIIWDSSLSKDEKRYIHYNSMNNFLNHYDDLNDLKKTAALELFIKYVDELKKKIFNLIKMRL